jgi:hypothetical protein
MDEKNAKYTTTASYYYVFYFDTTGGDGTLAWGEQRSMDSFRHQPAE